MVAERGPRTRTVTVTRAASPVIGVDFDNTLVSYDRLMGGVAADRGLVPAGATASKRQIRDAIRALPGGEMLWRAVQGVVYGPRLNEAVPMDGVASFLRLCKEHGVPLYVASHKTEYGHSDASGTNLRTAAMDWMIGQGFFDNDASALVPDHVYFEPTRAGKLNRIRRLGCTHFIDDLEETFLEDGFPEGVERILYAPDGAPAAPAGVTVMSSWKELGD